MKKVLIVAYYWPPAGGPGVQRWLHFVKYLPHYGISPVLYLPENPHYPITDDSLEDQVPEGLTVYRKSIWEPYSWASRLSKKRTGKISSGIIPTANPSFLDKVLLWIRGNLFIPDARKYWVKPSIQYLDEILDKEGIQTVITTGPPHSLHLIGMGLKQRKMIRWIADFRDPWTSIGYHKALRLTKTSRKRHQELERAVLETADEILVTSRTTGEEFGKWTRKPITVITNGYDLQAAEPSILDTSFTISHIGSLLSERNPVVLWKVLAELCKEDPDFRKSLQIQLIGVVSEEVVSAVRNQGLEEALRVCPYLAHSDAIRAQRRSQVLLLVEINEEHTKGIIPGKLFEYMAAGRPVLAIGPEDWEAGALVRETDSGEVFTFEMKKELKRTLRAWFRAYQKSSLDTNSQAIEKYSRKSLTGKLAERILWE
jgi:glycosyltransferase involved in cell wall biosynthesis